MIYKKQFEIGLKDIGKNNEITNTALLERLENIAAYHSDSAGYGVSARQPPSRSFTSPQPME